LVMSFFMGVFVATFTVASQSLFLQNFTDPTDLPAALFFSGVFALVATLIYNFLQNRIPFPVLAGLCISVITILTAFIEFGQRFFDDLNVSYFRGFVSSVACTFLTFLTFWGSFGRLFNLRQSKRLLNSADQGTTTGAFFAYL